MTAYCPRPVAHRPWQRPGFWLDLAGFIVLAVVVFPLVWGLLTAAAEYGR